LLRIYRLLRRQGRRQQAFAVVCRAERILREATEAATGRLLRPRPLLRLKEGDAHES
jgi:hypothetical protein